MTPKQRAQRYFRCLLVAATATSLAGNIAHTVTAAATTHTGVAVAVAAVAPLALAASVHGVAVAVRAGVTGTAYRLVLAAVMLIAGSAFILSWSALSALAAVAGHAGWTSMLLPVVVDATIAVSTAMLVVLDRPAATGGHPAATNGHPVATPAADAMTSGITVPPSHLETATELVQSGRVRADVTAVAAAVAGLAAGDSHRAVAAATGLHRTSVARVAAEVGG